MTRDELLERLSGYEWDDFEVKEAKWQVPNGAYETVSAFSNTDGGHLVFGVRHANGVFEILGVVEVDKVQGDFITTLRSGQKISKIVDVVPSLVDAEGKNVLVFYIPEANRREKPVCLNRDWNKSYKRKGGSSVLCSREEIQSMMVEASDKRFDGVPLEAEIPKCFEPDSLAWYRAVFATRNPSHDPTLSDVDFLYKWGFVVEQEGRRLPTRAGLLLFGSDPILREVLPRPVVDCRSIPGKPEDPLPPERWLDRVVIERNLVEAWKALMDWYLRHAERPFALDAASLQRKDTPPDFFAFREAAINLLIHQDYSDHTRTPTVQFFRGGSSFSNPGHAFASPEELLEPGDKDVRNPLIVRGFRMIGLSEQAGTGVRAIFQIWQQLGNVPPVIKNDKARRSFEILLPKEVLLSEEQLLYQAQIGVHLTAEEAKTFALAVHLGRLRTQDVSLLLSVPLTEANHIVERLQTQLLLSVSGPGSPYLVVAEHLKEALAAALRPRAARLVTDQPRRGHGRLVTDQPAQIQEKAEVRKPAEILLKLSPTQWKIVELCRVQRSLRDLTDALKFANRTYFRRVHLAPLLKAGLLMPTHSENPHHPEQNYILTEAGLAILSARRERQTNGGAERNEGV